MSVAAATREQSRARYPDEEGFVERDGVRVFYEVYGDAPTTFLLFPTVADLALAALEGADPVPLAPLPRRHVRPARERPLGPARATAEAYSWWEFVGDGRAVLEATAPSRAAGRRSATAAAGR